MRGEGLRASTVKVNARDILLDGFSGLHCEFGVGGAKLEDEVGLLDRMRSEDCAGDAVV